MQLLQVLTVAARLLAAVVAVRNGCGRGGDRPRLITMLG
jgi:hypothetical protein